MENKKEVVAKLYDVLKVTRAGLYLQSLELSADEEYVIAKYNDGDVLKICVAADSGIAICSDVIQAII